MEKERKRRRHQPISTSPDERPLRVVSFSKAVDLDKTPEAIRMKKFAVLSLMRHMHGSSVELVHTGPLAEGDILEHYRVIHMNFKVKTSDGEVMTYFCELRETLTNNDVRACLPIRLGPCHLLPEKADNQSCFICSSHNIHHPDRGGIGPVFYYQNGGLPYLKNLHSKVLDAKAFFSRRKNKTKADFNERFPEPAMVYFTRPHSRDKIVSAALQTFNCKWGSNFVFVKTGPSKSIILKLGYMCHLNFEAKKKDDLECEVETFFAEVIIGNQFLLVDYCNSLGPSFLLPGEPALHGCRYCIPKHGIHHPPGPGYLRGMESECEFESEYRTIP